MNTARPQTTDNTNPYQRTRDPIPKNTLKDDTIKKPARKLEEKSPLDYNFNEDDDSQLTTWLQQHALDPDFTFRGLKIVKIDQTNKKVTLKSSDGVERTVLLAKFLSEARQEIKFKKGSIRLDGKVVQRSDIVNLIKQDIQNDKPFKGQKILSIDESKNVVTIETVNFLGFRTHEDISLDVFISDYIKGREFGYLDSDSTVQNLAEQTRLQNISDMSQAIKDALGIKPPKVIGFAPVKDTRLVENVCSGMMSRDSTGVWSLEELASVFKSGNVPYSNKKVSGELISGFIPTQPALQAIKVSPPLFLSDKK